MTKNRILDDAEVKLYEKISEAKHELMQCDIKKSGYNKYHKYHYYELDDITPFTEDILYKHKLATKLELGKDVAVLHVMDLEGKCSTPYTFPLPPINSEGKTAIQDMGAYQTYARRYLTVQVFDIVDAEAIDVGESTKEVKTQEKKTNTQQEKTDNNTEDINSKPEVLPVTRTGEQIYQDEYNKLYDSLKKRFDNPYPPSQNKIILNLKKELNEGKLTQNEYEKATEYMQTKA